MKRILLVIASLIVIGTGVVAPSQSAGANGQVGFWTGNWDTNMGANIFLREGANQGGASYLVSGNWGTGAARCTVSGFTQEDNYFQLIANYRCQNGVRGVFTANLSRTRPHDRWSGGCRQTQPSRQAHGTMSAVRV